VDVMAREGLRFRDIPAAKIVDTVLVEITTPDAMNRDARHPSIVTTVSGKIDTVSEHEHMQPRQDSNC
jgi:hypothetical protein